MDTQITHMDVQFQQKQQEREFVEHFSANDKHVTSEKIEYLKGLYQRMEAFLKKGDELFNQGYTLLGVERGATKREIYNAYRRKARKMHPDVGGSNEAFQQLQDAYHKLLKLAPKA